MTEVSTSHMDGWEGSPDDPEQWYTHYICIMCGEWTLIKGTKETYGGLPRGAKCSHCNSTQLNSQSAISKRTFDIGRARQQSSKMRKLIENKKAK